jgi:diacylglycerol kinase (ATP)
MSISPDVTRDVALILVLSIAIVLLLLLVRQRRRRRPSGADAGLRADGRPPQAAVVVHGGKVDDQDTRRQQIEVLSDQLGWRSPLWLETTSIDPGRSQTRQALDGNPAVVVAFGGDGTARIVAEVMARTGVPMGLLPAGTGNLLARNLGIPPNRLDSSLHIALTGRDRTIDIGHVEIGDLPPPADPVVPVIPVLPVGTAEPESAGPMAGPLAGPHLDRVAMDGGTVPSGPVPGPELRSRRETFLVMAGLGFDAEIMAGADAQLKERLGWGAYVVSGVRSLRGRRTPVTIRVDDGALQHRRIRTVVVGNCGMLQGGIQLMPGALVDDGWLDVVVISPRSLLGWLSVTGAVITRRPHTTVEHFRCRSIEVRAERPLHAQLDGDPAGIAQYLKAGIDPLALKIRVPD